MNIESLRVSMLQSWIDHEDVVSNMSRYGEMISGLSGESDLVILPELFTGGSVRVGAPAERMDGAVIGQLREWSGSYNLAIVGSMLVEEGGKLYNRGVFVVPSGEVYCADKRHLFVLGGEGHLSAGSDRLIVSYLGWRICLLICFDLRFPVWSRNVGCEYDLLLYPSNWPVNRMEVWEVLLRARAMENQVYVCGVNRVGVDGLGIEYVGGSRIISPRGEVMLEMGMCGEVGTLVLSHIELERYRIKFPVWRSVDGFSRIERGISSIC